MARACRRSGVGGTGARRGRWLTLTTFPKWARLQPDTPLLRHPSVEADTRVAAGLIPTSRSMHGPGQPGVAGERAEAARLGGEFVPGGAGGVHDRLVAAREDAMDAKC